MSSAAPSAVTPSQLAAPLAGAAPPRAALNLPSGRTRPRRLGLSRASSGHRRVRRVALVFPRPLLAVGKPHPSRPPSSLPPLSRGRRRAWLYECFLPKGVNVRSRDPFVRFNGWRVGPG
ncbi:hypothetical protein PVAP13_1NG199538 [Panicum virgatum]|uniref:Uncharacterized protein n=1 Tax=Panicum virgatum TaxID=38727 RepID=A0A8T0X550_PANVG|nr:hypothetical protein PVAP13_1NG199538 [Panicum virgatum]